MILLRKYDTGVNWIKNVFYVIFCSGKWCFYANTTLFMFHRGRLFKFPQSSHSSPLFPLFPSSFKSLPLISFPSPLMFSLFFPLFPSHFLSFSLFLPLIFPLYAYTSLYFPLFILIFLCCLWVVNEVTGRSFRQKSDVSRTLTAWVSVNGAWSASVKRQQNYQREI